MRRPKHRFLEHPVEQTYESESRLRRISRGTLAIEGAGAARGSAALFQEVAVGCGGALFFAAEVAVSRNLAGLPEKL